MMALGPGLVLELYRYERPLMPRQNRRATATRAQTIADAVTQTMWGQTCRTRQTLLSWAAG